jgi:GNAT superfamily N-acetyltransferase
MSQQWTLPLEFRDFESSDYERLAELYGKIFPEYNRTANEWHHWDSMVDKSRYYFHRFTCLSRGQREVLGFGQAQHSIEMHHPNKFWLEIWVDPEHQKRGVGRAIYEKLTREMAEKAAVTVWAGTREDMTIPIGFAQRRGFVEVRRAWESRIDPSKFDAAPFGKYSEKAAGRGIKISTLAEERKHDPRFKEKLHELVNLVSADMPRPGEFTPIPYEQWVTIELDNPDLTPEGYMIARDGEKYVGLSALWRSETEPHGLYQGNTGVRKEYRGQGIAVSLKLRVLEFAKKGGYELVKTWNDSTNAAMLGINMKLGFRRQVGWIIFEKNLA